MSGIDIALVGIAIALGWQIAASAPKPKRIKIRVIDKPKAKENSQEGERG